MAISMRLSRAGSKRRPYYRIVVAEDSARGDRFIEKIGTYNPLLSKDDTKAINIDAERAKHWLSAGAKPTERVLRFLEAARVSEQVKRDNSKKDNLVDKDPTHAKRYIKNINQNEVGPAFEKIYSIRVNLLLDDDEALAKLTESAQKFMNFLGYKTIKEPKIAELAVEVAAEVAEKGGAIEW